MPAFLSIVLFFVVGAYVLLYTEVASRMPFGNANTAILIWGPLVLFTLAVLVALIFVTAKLGRIERLLDDQRPHR